MMSNWSSIIFATRKLAVLALKTLLQSMPSLKFLKVDGLMGYGGPVAAGSVTGKVGPLGLTDAVALWLPVLQWPCCFVMDKVRHSTWGLTWRCFCLVVDYPAGLVL